MACGMALASVTGASSTNQTPSTRSETHCPATSFASLVLPAPPGPTIVTSRPVSSNPDTLATSSSRPMKLVSDERRLLRRRRAPAGGIDVRGNLATQHGELQRLELSPRVDAEFVGQPVAQPFVHRKGVGGPAGRGQRTHQLTGKTLPQRVGGGQFLQVADDVGTAAEPELRLEPIGLGVQSLLGQPGDRGRRVAGVAGVDQRITPPQRERLDQGVPRADRRAVAQFAPAGRHQV